jgi:transposase
MIMGKSATTTASVATQKAKSTVQKTAVKPKKTQPKKATIIKQCMALDIAKDDIQICFRESMSDGAMRVKTQKKVKNTKTGWNTIVADIKKHLKTAAPNGFVVVMEATGVYHENVCYFLSKQGYTINVVLPNMSKSYIKSLGQHSKNDKIDAQALAQMGLERVLNIWVAPSDNTLKIKHLSRERQMLIADQTSIKNQLHAFKHGYECEKSTEKRFDTRLKLIAKQIKEIDQLLIQTVNADEDLRAKAERICTIQGFGMTTVIVLLAETNAFDDIENRAQLTSYAGYDVVENQSGKHTGKTRISKRGNSRIRAALHFPALTAVKYNDTMKKLYNRVFDRTKIKMKAYVAVQRKMLLLAYAVCKNETDFDPKYQENSTKKCTENAQENTNQKPINKKVDTAKDSTYTA